MLIKNQIYEAEITDYTAEGQGVAHIEGCAVFIPNAVAGEKVRVRVEKAQKTWAAGKIVEILEKSPHRVNRECEVAKLCGGCDFWHMDYAEETRLKAQRVKNCLNRIGGARKIVHIVFSTTDDLTAAYPATAVRLAGLTDAPLFSCKEPAVDGALPLCIRALVLIAEYGGDETPPAHVYLHGAKKLRPDLTERNE